MERERSRLEVTLTRLLAEVGSIENPAEEIGTTHFFLAYQGQNDRDLLARLAAIYRRATPELEYVAPHCQVDRSPSTAEG